MAIFSNKTSIVPIKATAGTKAEKPQAKVWLNIGYTHVDSETGGTTFVGLPLGIPVDTMDRKSAGSSLLMQAKNVLLDEIQAFGDQLEPGEEYLVPELCIQIRRVNAREEATAETNPFIASLNKLTLPGVA